MNDGAMVPRWCLGAMVSYKKSGDFDDASLTWNRDVTEAC